MTDVVKKQALEKTCGEIIYIACRKYLKGVAGVAPTEYFSTVVGFSG